MPGNRQAESPDADRRCDTRPARGASRPPLASPNRIEAPENPRFDGEARKYTAPENIARQPLKQRSGIAVIPKLRTHSGSKFTKASVDRLLRLRV
jgi:hypothetical protein